MKKQMAAMATIILFIAASLVLSRCKDDDTNEKPEFGGYESQVKWGEQLVLVGGCGDCHTPKKMTDMGPVDDSTLLLSGHPAQQPLPDFDRSIAESKGLIVTQTLTSWIGPWGVSYAANITSDTTGIGVWKEEQFIKAMREGVFKGISGSRPLLPPMPWPSIRHLKDDELKAMFAYLKSTKPIPNVVPAPTPPMMAPPMGK